MRVDDLITHVRALPEIELLELMKGVGEHLRKNNIEHLIDQVFEVGGDVVDDLQNQIDDLEDDVSKAEESRDEYKMLLKVSAEKLEEIKQILEK